MPHVDQGHAAGVGTREGVTAAEAVPRWAAAGLSAAASLLHWIGGENHSHELTADAVLLVVAASAQMLLAVVLATAPWRELGPESGQRVARAVFLAGAAVMALVVASFLIPLMLIPGGTGEHAAHAGTQAQAVAAIDVAAAGVETAAIALLLWMAIRPARPRPRHAATT